ncbi:MAG TPA: ATP-binding protein [Phnomibacter sp.]|nr:ATP-binding protein [Phnomibacter sp.]
MYIIVAVIAASSIALYFSYRKRQQLKLKQALAQQQQQQALAVIQAREQERKRIAADLHDNLGAYGAALAANVENLNAQLTTVTPALTHIERNVQAMVSELNSTIWVLQKETQLLTDIFDRLKIWVHKIAESYPHIHFSFAETGQDEVTLNPGEALHLFHILQEAINNAVRHSRCTQININLQSSAGWCLWVEDNGKGLAQEIKYAGNGLQNMQQRAAINGWHIAWEPAVPAGTRVVIRKQPV